MENLDKNISSREIGPQLPERKFWKLISEEPAFVSILSEKDPSDIEWYKKLDKSPEVQEWMIEDGEEMTEEDIETKESKKPLLRPKLSIVGYTDPINELSEKVLEKSGFKIVGKIKYEPDSEKEDNFWVLDWNKLTDFYARKDEERMKK